MAPNPFYVKQAPAEYIYFTSRALQYLSNCSGGTTPLAHQLAEIWPACIFLVPRLQGGQSFTQGLGERSVPAVQVEFGHATHQAAELDSGHHRHVPSRAACSG